MTLMLSENQLKQFDEEGWLFFEDVFDTTEVSVLNQEAHRIFTMEREEIFREKDGTTARTAFAAQNYNEAYRRLGRHPRLVEPVKQLLSGDVYMHQFKINAKAAFNGDVWQWHQDFGVWHRDDEMPEPRAMNIALFLEDVTEFNGALMFIPRSHKGGVIKAGHDLETTSYPLWTLDRATVKQLADEGGVVAPVGEPGSVLLFHGNLVHASPPNISPWDRVIVYLSLCAVSNHITKFTRKPWIAHRDFTPIKALADDCLQELVDQAKAKTAAE